MEIKLKRLSGIIVYLLLICQLGIGQSAKNTLSLNFNPYIAMFYGNGNLNGFKPIPAFAIGLTYGYYLSPKIKIQTGVMLEQKGGGTEVYFFDINGHYLQTSKVAFRREYITVPLTCAFVSRSKLKFYLGVGLYLSYLLDAKDKDHILILSEQTKSLDFGAIVETGVFLPIHHRLYLDIGIKDCLGFSTTLMHEAPTRNNTIGAQIGLNWKF